VPLSRPVLRCFPRADRVFQAEAQRLFDAWTSEARDRPLDSAAFQTILRSRFPSAFVREQDPLAAFARDAIVWYVHRRDEPSALPSDTPPATPGTSPAVVAEARRADGPGSAPVYSSARVAEMAGLPISLLVRWDEEDAIVRPARTSSGLALYSRNDVEAILLAKRLFARGDSTESVREALVQPSRSTPASAPPSVGRKLLVLLAERDPYAAEFSEYFLRTEGYEVEVALTALEAETRAAELLPDLAVVELLISGGAGAELCARLKVRPQAKVLAISTLDFEDGALRAGADAFLSKPFDPLAFVSTVKDLLGESAMLRTPDSRRRASDRQAAAT
jgi:CheY-like chemotaxis protein